MTSSDLLTRSVTLRRLAAALMAGAAVVHLGVASPHFAEWWAAGAFFVVTGVAQLVWAAATWTAPAQRRLLLAGAALNVAMVVVWAVSRLWGLPFGPEAGTPEAVGVADVVTVVLELGSCVLVAFLLPLAGREQALTRSGGAPGAASRVGVATAAAAVLVLLAAGGALAVPESHGHDHAAATSAGSVGHAHGASANGERHGIPNLPDAASATAAQTTAARDFLVRTEADTARYRDLAAAKAAGFDVEAAWQAKQAKQARRAAPSAQASPSASPTRSRTTTKAVRPGAAARKAARAIQLVHVPNTANRTDGRVLDPSAPETLIYGHRPDGTFVLVGVMFTAEQKAPPADALQPYLRWHFHEKCITRSSTGRSEQKVPTSGTCPSGSTLRRTGYMTHVWFVAPTDLVHAYAMNPPRAQLVAYQATVH